MRLWSDGNIQWGEVALDIFCHLMETLKHGDEHIWNILYSKQNSLHHSASVRTYQSYELALAVKRYNSD